MSSTAKWKKEELEKNPKYEKEKIDFEAEHKKILAENSEQKKIITILNAAAFFSQDHLK